MLTQVIIAQIMKFRLMKTSETWPDIHPYGRSYSFVSQPLELAATYIYWIQNRRQTQLRQGKRVGGGGVAPIAIFPPNADPAFAS